MGTRLVKLIRVRHDLAPPAKALLASIDFDYVIDPYAPECVTWADGRDVKLKPGRCPACKRVERERANR